MFKRILLKYSIIADLLSFFWKERLWWMMPLVIALILLGLLIFFSQGSAVAPFIYTLF